MITIPFEVEKAKRIQDGEEPGKVVTRDGIGARIVCWDRQDDIYPIIALLWNKERSNEACRTYTENGYLFEDREECKYDLTLQVPEWTQYKEGDILVVSPEVVVIFNRFEECTDCCKTKFFVASSAELKKLYFPYREENHFGYREDIKGYANEEQKQQLIDALKASTDSRAKEYLKRFFGIEEEEKPECEFETKDWILGRTASETWCLCQFSHKETLFDGKVWYMAIGGIGYSQCIPYNEQTKHLLGTTDDWEE